MLTASNINVNYDSHPVLQNFSITINAGEIIALIGPNGCGKSTVLKALSGLIKPKFGHITLDDQPLEQWSRRTLARRLSLLPQSPSTPEGLTVRQLLRQGRFAHLGLFRGFREEDHQAIEWALDQTNLKEYADRSLMALSGGERQRAWIAAALAQESDILLLDEPTSYLDIGHQIEVLALVRRLSKQRKKTIVLSIHDLNHAMAIADRILLLGHGKLLLDGTADELAASGQIEKVFQINGEFVVNQRSGIQNLEVQIPA